MTTNATGILIGILFVLGIAYDVCVYVLWGTDATLSKAMQQIGLSWPIVIVAYGGLGAHFFCPKNQPCGDFWCFVKPYVLLLLGAIIFRLAWPQAWSAPA